MTYEQIEKELESHECDIYFTSMLPSFVWSETKKCVEPYSEVTTKENKLLVFNTELINLDKKTLTNYLKEQEVSDTDVLIFCINENYYPKTEGNYVRLKILRNVNKSQKKLERIVREQKTDKI